MVTLAIDTSAEHCSVALRSADGPLVGRSEYIGRGHAERLLPLIDEVMQQSSRTYADVSRIIVVRGPGTFTGLRIGLSVARGLALSLGVPCIGCSGLLAYAAGLEQKAQVVHAVIKGRGGQAFHQTFDWAGQNVPRPLTKAACLDAQNIADNVAQKPGPLVGDGAKLVLPLLPEETAALSGVPDHPHINPEVVARLAENLSLDDNPPEPLYLRPADAKRKAAEFVIAEPSSRDGLAAS